MPAITEEEFKHRVKKFVETHISDYTTDEANFLIRNAAWGANGSYVFDILRQIYDEVGLIEDDNNMYEGFARLLEDNFDINRDIVEIGGGIVPSLAKRVALRQKSGTVTVYDPRLIMSIPKSSNLIMKKEKFEKNTQLEGEPLLIGCMPCDSTIVFIETACEKGLDFMLALCEGGERKGYEWLENDDEWISTIKRMALKGMKDKNMGTLEVASLGKYGNPFPVIYNKRLKS